ncbi:hypothetical protein HYDPIDRAFT_93555 [Hydnomerulius pinastri MD-312]|uniref:Unplaced genomic scaffold scaffold_19, whole genome shotgun sequence n=1 Tax=Hydnomerulius pinastri MD-312 TaxID=994086 RepID=A0A0C9W704_9AGAM|nr:hypothetical protein HYDPIDRAFT_93555 [Hydnomerulius pinastri MD-312]
MSTSPQVWFVTGASSGFGRAITDHVLRQGNKVIATLRKPEVISDLVERYTPEQLLVLKLDVTKPSEVVDAFARAREVFGRIDVVFNNAGYAVVGELEGTRNDVARGLFETNFWGAVNVSLEAIKFFREVNQPQGGRLLQISSMVGLTAAPGIGFYSATKFALEGFTESLVQELDPKWNIKVSIVAPGPFKTKGVLESATVEPVHPAYTDETLGSAQQRQWFDSKTADGDSEKAAIVLEKLAHLDNPPLRFPIHKVSITLARQKAERVQNETDAYESWSEGVYFE